MKQMTSVDKLKVLVVLGDQLWDDYDNGFISEQEYGTRAKVLKKQIEEEINVSFSDIQNICNSIGYILIKKVNPFTRISKFSISKN